MEEKRSSSRIGSMNLSYICLDEQGKVFQQAMGRTINISEGGFLIETHSAIQEGYTLIGSIGLGDDTIDIKGKIMHCKPLGDGKYVAGVMITFIEENDRSLWTSYIKEMSSDEVPEKNTDI
jgi:hypothetical protein